METGQVCWVDLAARDLHAARVFYRDMFGWEPVDCRNPGGSYTKLHRVGEPFGSMYQLDATSIQSGTPSRWLPYVRVADIAESCALAAAIGGQVLVRPFDAGPARIALVMDPAGAQIGLWDDGPAP